MGQTDIENSIRTRTLKLNDSLSAQIGRWFQRVFFFLLGTVMIYFSLKDAWGGFLDDNLPISRVIVTMVIISFASWMIYGAVNVYRLSLIKGTDKIKNRELMYDLLNEMFTDTKFFFIDDLLIGTRPWTMKIPGKEINVIFTNSDMYINIVHKVRFGDMDSLFHVLTNQADL